MPSSEAMTAVADAYVDAYKRSDKEALLALFAPDAHFEDPVGQPAHVGRAAIGEFWDQAHAMAQIELRRKDLIVCANEMAMTFEIHATIGDSTMLMDAIDVFVCNDEGKITSLKAYWDMARARPH
jgi:steroid delta-isomerase